MTAILQISDTHIVPEGKLVSGRLDSAAALARLVARINAIRDQMGALDAVVVTGDLTHNGDSASFKRFRDLMAPLELPLLVIPGNHDARAPMRAAFDDHLPTDGPLNWTRQIGAVRLIGLDTLVEGQGLGTLTDASLEFLRHSLAEAAGSPVLLALHHPPFLSGIAFMDRITLTNRADLQKVLTGYSGELRLICGHIHAMMVTQVAGHIAISAPSPASTFAYDRRAEAPVGFMDLGDGCLLHRWEEGFQSVRIGPEAGTGPYTF